MHKNDLVVAQTAAQVNPFYGNFAPFDFALTPIRGHRCASDGWPIGLAIGRQACGGRVAEWSIAAVLKTADVQASVGSNPTPSANFYSHLVIVQPAASSLLHCRYMLANQGDGSSVSIAYM